MWMMNLEKPTKMPQLNETMAIDLGSQILGEAVIFLVAATLVCIEYSRQAHNEERKEEIAREELFRLESKIQQLSSRLDNQVVQIQGLYRTMNRINNDVGFNVPQNVNSRKKDKTSSPTMPDKTSIAQLIERPETIAPTVF